MDNELVAELVGRHDARVGVGRGDKAVVGAGRVLGGVGVAGTHHGRIDKAVLPFLRHKELGVVEFNYDGVAWHDIGDIHGKDIGTALLQKRGAFAFLLGLLVVGTGFLFLLNLCTNDAVADGHLHRVNCGTGGHGEGVDGLERVFAAVDIDLLDGDIGNGAGNGGLDCCFFQRELVGSGILADDNEVG